MSLISMEFLTFVAVAVIGYYLIPKKYQWVWLLAFSYIYYASSGMKYLVFLLYTTVVTYGTARMIYGADQKFAEQKEKIKTYKKSIMVLALLLDFGMLAVLKYTNFTISNINTLFHADIRMVKFLLPLGISFYTFQSVGYILDVYWKRYEPEKNIFKFALFVSFFPQILQGPIGRYSNLAHQFYEEHSFDFMRIERGVQRVLWGFFKKMVIADTAAVPRSKAGAAAGQSFRGAVPCGSGTAGDAAAASGRAGQDEDHQPIRRGGHQPDETPHSITGYCRYVVAAAGIPDQQSSSK